MDTIEPKLRQMLDDVAELKQRTPTDSRLVDMVIRFVKELLTWKHEQLDAIEKDIKVMKDEIVKIEQKQNGHSA